MTKRRPLAGSAATVSGPTAGAREFHHFILAHADRSRGAVAELRDAKVRSQGMRRGQAWCAMEVQGRFKSHKIPPLAAGVAASLSSLVACRICWAGSEPRGTASSCRGPDLLRRDTQAPHSVVLSPRHNRCRTVRTISSWAVREASFADREKFWRTKPFSYRYERTGCR
jgi:hypothetical protein